jgi:hypothetical protein
MNRTLFSFLILFTLTGAMAASAQPAVPSSSLFDPQSASKASTHEDEVYQNGTEDLSDGDYDEAVKNFAEVANLRGRKADAALYWEAYALKMAGNTAQAQATIGELRRTYPQSKWLKDAAALEIEMKGAAANPENISDEELKLLALQSLMNSDPEKAVPLLDKVIHGNYSPRLKDKALFVLSQSNSDQAQKILLSLAKSNNDPELQKRAIRYIGMSGRRNSAILKEIYNGTNDTNVKKECFQGWLMSGDRDAVLAVARTEKSPELRKDAIRYLGMMGGRTELREMYKSSPDPGTREAVIQGMLMSGDSQGLAEIANTEKDPDVLEKAINTLGMVGGQDSITALTNIYNTHTQLEIKKRVINGLFLRGAAKEMVAMARKETNPELKKAWIQKLSLMNSPEVTEYMMEILNK